MKKAVFCLFASGFSYYFSFYPEDGGEVPPKRRLRSHLHGGATSKKTAFFIVTAVKTSNLT
jgi:hypothetical protein